MGKDSQHFYFI